VLNSITRVIHTDVCTYGEHVYSGNTCLLSLCYLYCGSCGCYHTGDKIYLLRLYLCLEHRMLRC